MKPKGQSFKLRRTHRLLGDAPPHVSCVLPVLLGGLEMLLGHYLGLCLWRATLKDEVMSLWDQEKAHLLLVIKQRFHSCDSDITQHFCGFLLGATVSLPLDLGVRRTGRHGAHAACCAVGIKASLFSYQLDLWKCGKTALQPHCALGLLDHLIKQ